MRFSSTGTDACISINGYTCFVKRDHALPLLTLPYIRVNYTQNLNIGEKLILDFISAYTPTATGQKKFEWDMSKALYDNINVYFIRYSI